MEQSKTEKRPPQTAKLPPILGAFIRTAWVAPIILAPLGELYRPLIKWKAEPPTAPIPNAPPTSSRIRSGHGSLEVSGVPMAAAEGLGGGFQSIVNVERRMELLIVISRSDFANSNLEKGSVVNDGKPPSKAARGKLQNCNLAPIFSRYEISCQI